MNKTYLILLMFVLALGLLMAAGGQGLMAGQDDSQDSEEGDLEDSFDDSNETENESEDEIEIDDDDNGKKIRIRDSEAHSDLNLTQERVENKTRLRVHLSNGFDSEIKVMPDTASERALEVLNAKCGERNCSIELKEVASNNGTRAAYEVQAEKEAKVLGLFKTRMQVQAQVDAETGEVIQTKKPWWAFLAKED